MASTYCCIASSSSATKESIWCWSALMTGIRWWLSREINKPDLYFEIMWKNQKTRMKIQVGAKDLKIRKTLSEVED